jgi:hypothetical protein
MDLQLRGKAEKTEGTIIYLKFINGLSRIVLCKSRKVMNVHDNIQDWSALFY